MDDAWRKHEGSGSWLCSNSLGVHGGIIRICRWYTISLGIFNPLSLFFLLATMIVATMMHIGKGDPFLKYSHAMESGILFLSLILIGPGKYSLDGQIYTSRKKYR